MRNRWSLFFVVCVLLCLQSPAWCNLATYKHGDPAAMKILVVFFDTVTDVLFLFITLIIIKKIDEIPAIKIFTASVLMIIGGFTADSLGFIGAKELFLGIQSFNGITGAIIEYAIIPFFFIFCFNVIIGCYVLKLSTRECIILGSIVGFFTMPILYVWLFQPWGLEPDKWNRVFYEIGPTYKRIPSAPVYIACLVGIIDLVLIHHYRFAYTTKDKLSTVVSCAIFVCMLTISYQLLSPASYLNRSLYIDHYPRPD